ncbi:MAG: 2Fe-2S iron-sulfur cluster-binding protein [Clostridia bacterium]|jgi:NADH dehydrogenase/NADH:ubiquinone oxidoreductase subunit G|nr:2Fe-2S iron-sulfur cluster-binding protein [Clostridia bacterium]MDH7572813.1 2Fe-2S iron-sulfur cluster-binding protein [Clostridia bacterium]
MSEVTLQIDGIQVRATEDMTVLEAAKNAGISIPTLCYHEKLEPYGACRLCMVEVESGGRTRLVVSCVYPVEDGLIVRTKSERLSKIRKTIIELLMAHAPDSPVLQELAAEYGAERDRFAKQSSFCLLCGLCVRYCAEVKKKYAIGFVDRGIRREISFVPEVAARECWNCKECFSLCPTSYLQAVYVLTEALAGAGR